MGNGLRKVNTHLCENRWILLLSLPKRILLVIFSFILIGIRSVYYINRQKEQPIKTIEDDGHLTQCEDEVIKLPDQQQVAIPVCLPFIDVIKTSKQIDVCLFSPAKSHTVCIASVDFYAVPTVEINKSIDRVFPLREERKLVCYCDGSYSHHMQIGHSGFRASDGAYRVRFFSPRHPKNGSTDTEVFAAYLAIQYALGTRYNTLIIHTDNSKVEQLLKRPKNKDNIKYSDICQILDQYRQQQGKNTIQVVRVRGHTSKYEQQNCNIKYEFAKIDQTVRKKTRQYIKRMWIRFEKTYCYWYEPDRYSYYAWQVLGSYA